MASSFSLATFSAHSQRVLLVAAAAVVLTAWSGGAARQPESPSSRAADTATGTIEGRVTVESGAIPDLVVYLEPKDAARLFPVPADQPIVSQKGARFSPELLVVCVGQTVRFANNEDRPIEHNVFSRSPAKPFDLGLYRPGLDKSVTFDKPGPVRLYCSIHRYMDGVVFVSPTPFHARVSAEGAFRIAHVPAGDYLLKTWQRRPRFREKAVDVTVAAGSVAAAEVRLTRK